MGGIGGIGGMIGGIGGMMGAVMGGQIGNMINGLATQFLSSFIGQMIQNSGLPPFAQQLLQQAVDGAFGQQKPANAGDQLNDLLDLFRDIGMSMFDIGAAQRGIDELKDAMQEFLKNFLELLRDATDAADEGNGGSRKPRGGGGGGSGGAEAGGGAGGAGSTGGAGGGEGSGGAEAGGGVGGSEYSSSAANSWFIAIAKALGKALQDLADEIKSLSDQLTGIDATQGSDAEKEKAAQDRVDIQTELQGLSQKFSFAMQTASTVIKGIGEGMAAMARKQ